MLTPKEFFAYRISRYNWRPTHTKRFDLMSKHFRLFFATQALGLVLIAILSSTVIAAEKRHAAALIGAPKYGPDFKHFDYVNPEAPKGGKVRMAAFGTFDTFNLLVYNGKEPGSLGLIYDTLMARSLDESSSEYGLLAEWMSYPEDYSSVTYKLREGARWHDGKPITVEDVIFSMNMLKKHNARYMQYYANVASAKKTGEREVTFTFDQKGNRELPQIVGQLPVFPKHFYDEKPEKRNPAKTWLEVPLGSGAYRIKKFEGGRYLVYERVKDYWGKDLPVNVGQHNFDEIRFDYFLDLQAAFETFKKGEIDFYPEHSAKSWATAYNFPAVKDGRIIKRGDVVLDDIKYMQAFVFNIRQKKFADVRVRKAFNLVFNFDALNKDLFVGQYKSTSSYFQKSEFTKPSELSAQGLPKGKELEILNEVRNQVPPEVFTKPYTNPDYSNSANSRRYRREAMKLLNEAGWVIQNGVLTNTKSGEAMKVEFLLAQPTFERVVQSYQKWLEGLGIAVSIRTVDTAQYRARLNNFQYEIIVHSFPQSESPGNEQREFWGSVAADIPGSRNKIGIKNPAIDKLVDRIIFNKGREDLAAATRALDRVLLANYYVVPQWYAPYERFSYWNRFSHAPKLPSYSVGFPTIWWYDQAKAAKLGH
jgi:microcin C transport system substrate-binding protein